MGRIHRLTDELINQIAAGEVVERPASVIKELAENALDAGATWIRVAIAKGGLESMTVTDDGCGMSRGDAVLSLERHATSKLLDAEGLLALSTKGFRGEALPSIASVSRFALSTSEPGAAVGTRVAAVPGQPMQVEDAGPIGGTHIRVDDLFFNTPARRKFLKRESTELSHCEEAITRLALAHPEVGFSLEHDGRPVMSAAPTPEAPRERVIALMGAEVAPHLLAVEERRLGLRVSGFVASPEFTLATARGLFLFVNRRFIRDRALYAAVQRAFRDSLPPGRQPVVALFIDVDPQAVDVNVHPQKLEVRFADPRGVQEAVGFAVAGALKAAPWRNAPGMGVDASLHSHYALAVERFLQRAQQVPGRALEPDVLSSSMLPVAAESKAAYGTLRPTLNEAPPPGYFAALRFIGELGHRLWLLEGPGASLVVVDPQAAMERVSLSNLWERLRLGPKESSPGLFSATVELESRHGPSVQACAPSLARLGIEVEHFGGSTFKVGNWPEELEGVDWAPLLVALAAAVPALDAAPSDWLEALGLMAHASALVQAPQRAWSHQEIRHCLVGLDSCDFGLAAIRGRVVVLEAPLLSLLGGANGATG